MLLFQRSNPRGEEKELVPCSSTLPTVTGACPLPSPTSRPFQTPGTTRPQACLQLPKLKAQAGVWVAVGGP